MDSELEYNKNDVDSITHTNLLCNYCNYTNRLNSKFCRNCGKRIFRGNLVAREEKNSILRDFDFNRAESNISEEDLKREAIPEGKGSLNKGDHIFSSVISKYDRSKALPESASYVIKALFFIENLKESYKMELGELEGLVNCHKYIFENFNKGIALIETDSGRIITFNSRFKEFVGCAEDELINESFISLIYSLNNRNKEVTMNSIADLTEFIIFNKNFDKLFVTVRKSSEIFNNPSLTIILDSEKEIDTDKLKKDKTATRKLFLVSKIAEEINSSLDINIILNNTIDRVMTVTRSDAGLIMFMGDDKQLHLKASKGVSEELIEDLSSRAIEADSGSRRRALSEGKTVEAKMNFEGRKRTITGSLRIKEGLHSIVTVPLKSKEEVIGIMSLGRRSKTDYTGKDMQLLDAIANHITIAVKNSRLYEQVKNQLEELETKNSKLEELEQVKKRLTNMIVHDFKNPLTTIMSGTEYIIKKIDDKILLNICHSIYSGSQDILQMTMNLLDISKMEEGKLKLKFSLENPEKIINEILRKLHIKLSKKNIEIIKNIPEDLIDLKFDETIFYRLITNLLDNAIKYSPAGGKIKIEIKIDESKGKALFCISDRGNGIPKKYHKDIFEPFFTIDADEKIIKTSTGIGLSFCKFAVESHGGEIWVENNRPMGSKFYFTFPLMKD